MINPVQAQQPSPYSFPLPAAQNTAMVPNGVFSMMDDQALAPPVPQKSGWFRLVFDILTHPTLKTITLVKRLGIQNKSGQSFAKNLAMYRTLQKNLSSHGKKYLYGLLKSGRLMDISVSDQQSTLAHLYSIVTTPRAQSLDAKTILEDTVRLLDHPETVTQKFGTLTQNNIQALVNYYHSGLGPKITQPLSLKMLQVNSSATCVASSVMFYMLHREPSEFVRQVSQLSSPRLAFYQKVSASELSPEDPSQAAQIINDYQLQATAAPGSNGSEFWVKVDLPYSGVVVTDNQLKDSRLAFYQKFRYDELSPEQLQKIYSREIDTYQPPGEEDSSVIWVKMDKSPGKKIIREANQDDPHSDKFPKHFHPLGRREILAISTRGPVESMYQGALTHLAVRTYDPGLDERVNPDGTLDDNKGLEEDRKTLMESIVKNNGGEMSVTYQFTAAGQSGDPYLMGYYRSFDQTTQDLVRALDAGQDIIVGITDTDQGGEAGKIVMGHELTVTGYERDRKTGEIIFTVADSDDGVPTLVKRPASQLVPMIHHAGFPVKQAMQIWNQINTMPQNQYMLPDQNDASHFHLLATVPPAQQQAFLANYQRMVQEEDAQQQGMSQPSPQGVAQQPIYPFQYPSNNYAYGVSYPQNYYAWQYRPVSYSYPSNPFYAGASAYTPAASLSYSGAGYPYYYGYNGQYWGR